MATIREWQGRVGRAWAQKADAMDQLLGPVGREGFAGLSLAGAKILDLGCGAGQTSLEMQAMGANVTGVDVSADLLAVARERDPAGKVNWILADASQADLGGKFELLYSRCGAMFFDEPVLGWRHLRNEMMPGAPLRIVCWREAEANGWAIMPLLAARPVLGAERTQPAASGLPGPFAWADPGTFEPLLRSAGWKNITWRKADRDCLMEAGDHPDPIERGVAFAMHVGPMASRLLGVSEQTKSRVIDALRAALRAHLRDGEIRVSTAAWVISAHA